MTFEKTSPAPPSAAVGTRTPKTLPRIKERMPEGYVTRQLLLERSGATERDLKQFEGQGLVLADVRNDRNWSLYKEEKVDILRRLASDRPTRLGSIRKSGTGSEVTYSSREAAQVFALLKDQVRLDEIVMQTEIHPRIVTVIAKDYQTCARALLLLESDVEELKASRLDGANEPIRSARELIDALKRSFAKAACTACRDQARSSYCERCINDKRLSEERRAARANRTAKDAEPAGESDREA